MIFKQLVVLFLSLITMGLIPSSKSDFKSIDINVQYMQDSLGKKIRVEISNNCNDSVVVFNPESWGNLKIYFSLNDSLFSLPKVKVNLVEARKKITIKPYEKIYFDHYFTIQYDYYKKLYKHFQSFAVYENQIFYGDTSFYSVVKSDTTIIN
jgi:hypothetical protein